MDVGYRAQNKTKPKPKQIKKKNFSFIFVGFIFVSLCVRLRGEVDETKDPKHMYELKPQLCHAFFVFNVSINYF